MPQPSIDDLRKEFPELDPNQLEAKNSRKVGWWIWGAIILGAAIGASSIFGWNNWRAGGESTTENDPLPLRSLFIAQTFDDTAILLIDQDTQSGKIKLSKTTTHTVVIQDIATTGQGRIVAADLSPQKDRIVYVQETSGHREVIIVNVTNTSSPKTLGKEQLRQATNGNSIEPCTHTPIAWSPNGERFVFFGCDQVSSVILIVEMSSGLSPFSLENTARKNSEPQQLFWLDDESLLYNSYDQTKKKAMVNFIEATPDAFPVPIIEN